MGPASATGAGSFVEILRRHSDVRGDRPAFVYLEGGEREGERLTFGDLDRRARAIAARLAGVASPGDRALLLYPQSLDFVAAFFGCLYAGVVAVPAYPPRPGRRALRIPIVARDAGAAAALTTRALEPLIRDQGLEGEAGGALPVVTTDDAEDDLADAWEPPAVDGDTLAFLQYTSGSTGDPKGVMVSHRNIVHNCEELAAGVDLWEDPVMVSWAPTFHDLGLIFGVMEPVWGGFPCYLMSPIDFVQRPPRWLEAISRYRATHSGSPNFGFDLCLRKTPDALRRSLDLSSWRLALNGAEPIKPETLERFTATFAECGFRYETFCPAYGLAESTLKITSSHTGERAVTCRLDKDALELEGVVRAPAEGRDQVLVGVGRSWHDNRVAIVDPANSERLPEGRVGEIWAAGPSMARGYWNRPQATAETFAARTADGDGPFLRTGDLGFLLGGELFINGRIKDLIILRGRNHYPQDLELTAERSHPALRPGCSAAFAVDVEGEERPALVAEVVARHRDGLDLDEVFAAVRRAVAEEHEVELVGVALLEAKTVPKTSSGKIQRQAAKRGYREGTLAEIARFERRAGDALDRPVGIDREALLAAPPAERRTLLEVALVELAGRQLGARGADLGRDTPWSALGIDSLQAVTLQHRLEADLGLVWPMTRFLADPTAAELAAEGLEQLAAPPSAAPAAPAGVLSYNQRAMWFLYRLEPESAAYNVAFAAAVRSQVDPAGLAAALARVVRRHRALRTAFEERDGLPVAVVQDLPADFEAVDAAGWTRAELDAFLTAEARRPFNLARGPLLRARLLERSGAPAVLLVAVHHVAADFWSLGVILDELSLVYQARRRQAPPPLPPRGPAYADFVAWQAATLETRGDALFDFWRRRLEGAPPALDLPTDRPRPARQTYDGASLAFGVEAPHAQRLKARSAAAGATLYTTLLAAFQVLLHRLSGADDLTVGSPTAGRSRAAFEGLVGYLVNPVALRADLAGDPRFDRFLAATRRSVHEALEHQDYPFQLVVERLQPRRDPGRSPLFQVMFALQRAHRLEALSPFALGEGGHRLELRGLDLESYPLTQRIAQFDLTLTVVEHGGALRASLEYNSDLFDRTTARRFAGQYRHLLAGLATDPRQRVSEVPLLGAAERSRLLHEWNDTAAAPAALVHERFAARARERPEAVAAAGAGERVTYAELARRAGRLARHLRRLGVGPDDRVAVCLEPSPRTLAALLGVLEAGGAYLPLDPEHPARRLALMVDDAAAQVLIAEPAVAARLDGLQAAVVDPEDVPGGEDVPGAREPAPEHLAYVIYTSGSTGRPKGVAVSHGALAGYLEWCLATYPCGGEVPVHGSIAFDMAVTSLFAPLLAGGTVRFLAPEERGPALAAALAGAARWGFLKLTPSHLAGLEPPAAGPAALVAGGEPLDAGRIAPWLERLPGLRVFNEYGPTEATVAVSAFEATSAAGGAVPIGRPIAGARLVVVDRRLRPVPAGVRGELAIAGAGLARGYLGLPGRTAERFVPDPFAGRGGGRLYRTGDLARHLPDGNLDLAGRADRQVKIRGHRVELGEVESVLAAHGAVREAAVTARGATPGETRLVAYVVAADGTTLRASELRAFLAERLPAPMVPPDFVRLGELPRTPAGKLDLRGLPAPGRDRSAVAATFRPPRTPVEEILAGLWAEVLGKGEVGVDDDFFELGGHSLLATRLLARLRRSLGVELPVHAVFRDPTVAGLAPRVEAARRPLATAPPPPMRPAALSDATRSGEASGTLSFAQERLWFLDQLIGPSATYNLPAAFAARGPLDAGILGRALAEMCRRHDVLRAVFNDPGDGVVQKTAADGGDLAVIDLEGLGAAAGDAETRRLLRRLAALPFDLATGPLLRAALLRRSPASHVLSLVVHHIVADGESLQVLLRELAALIRAFSAGEPSPLPPLELRYADFARWQRERLRGDALDDQLAWWSERLEGMPRRLELPTDRPRPGVQTFRGRTLRFEVPGEVVAALRALGRSSGATLFMTLLAAFTVLLRRVCDQRDFGVGTPVSHRDRPELEALIGLFVNTLVLRADLAGVPTFRRLLERLRDAALDAYERSDLPFERLVEVLEPERDLSRPPLFQVMLAQQPALPPELPAGGVTLSPLALDGDVAHFDLVLFFEDGGDGGLQAMLEANRGLFDAATVARLAARFQTLAAAVAADPDRRVDAIGTLPRAEEHQLLFAWNDTERAAGDALCFHQLFEDRARRQGDAVAVEDSGRVLTYRGLDAAANRLAHRLRALGVGPGDRAGVCLERSLELIVAVLGVAKAGAAYVPVEPSYPADRIAFMLRDAGARVAIAGADAPPLGAGVEFLRPDVEGPSPTLRDDRPPAGADPAHLAYVIFTSGSTGRPKGVMLSHPPVVNLIGWVNRTFGVGPGDRLLFVTSPCFDLSVYDVFGTLAAGATVCVARRADTAEPATLAGLLQSRAITFWDSAPAALEQLTPFLPPPGAGSRRLRLVFLSGDWVPLTLPGTVTGAFPNARVVALGGATEAAIWSNFHPVETIDPAWKSVPYGVPIDNVRYLVLDRGLQPAPIGTPGDLYVGGGCLSAGYLRRPARTAAGYLPDYFSGRPGAVLYATGDRARWFANGTLEFLGRLDRQVKVRGFRVELGEIEAVLEAQDGVRQALAVVREEAGDRRLVAYVVAGAYRPAAGTPAADLRRALAAKLPEHMVPSAVVVLDAFPLTANGKVDRAALPTPAPPAAAESRPASGPIEELLAGLWQEVLGAGAVDRDASFFDLGGHSLLATRLAARLRRSLGVELPVRAVFEAPTVAELAARLEAVRRGRPQTAPPPLVAGDRSGEAPLSFAQQRLWFLDRLTGPDPTYNLSAALALDGALDLPALAASLSAVVRRHEALRTRFARRDGRPVQVVDPPDPVPVPIVDLEAAPGLAERLALDEARRPFDLARDRLFRVALLRLAAGGRTRHVLLVSMHHIVADGWSVGIFLREWSDHYRSLLESGRPAPLPALRVQVADFARWQRAWLSGETLETLARGWVERLRGAPPLLELPTDRPRPAVQSTRGRNLRFEAPPEAVRELEALGRRHDATFFMALLAAWGVLLARVSGQTDLVIGSPVANRRAVEIEPLIGLFVNTLALRLDLSGDPSFAALLGRVREAALDAYADEDLPFESAVEVLKPPRDLSHAPVFQVMFALQDAPVELLDLPGLEPRLLEVDAGVSRFDMTLVLERRSAGFGGLLEHSADLFDATTARRFARGFVTILTAAVEAPRAPLSALALAGRAERHQLLVAWNDTDSAVPETGGAGVYGLFGRRAARSPDAVAIAGDDGRDEIAVTYGGLAERTGALARRLRRLGVGPEVPVACCLERSVEMPLAMLGVLAAGGVYVPLDPASPPERLARLLADCRPAVLLTRAPWREALPAGTEVIRLDRAGDLSDGAASPAEPEPARIDPRHLSYVVYTSGSTGEPKGVQVAHGGLGNQIADAVRAIDAGPGDRLLQVAATTFDASIWEVLIALTSGATLCQEAPEHVLPGAPLAATLERRAITRTFLVPSALAALPRTASLPALSALLVGGEACPPELASRWSEGRRFLNAYGPTEATIAATIGACSGRGRPVIGRPMANLRARVLDRRGRPQPIGVAGELHVVGAGVARGYLGRPARTAAAFAPDPFGGVPGGRLYRTGDRVRALADGRLDFLGRVDRQVKLRGFRIEPGEIESVLGRHPAVREAAVVLDPRGGGRLVACVATATSATATSATATSATATSATATRIAGATGQAELRAHLKARLPEHMVPAEIRLVDDLPRTPSGKVDRAALARSLGRRGEAEPGGPPADPRGRTEQRIAEAWKQALGAAAVGRHDNFFDLGGHSLAMARVHARLERDDPDLSMVDLFRYPTIKALAAYLDQRARVQDPRAKSGAIREVGPRRAASGAVAVIGLSCRFPGAPDARTFWRNLESGTESITFFSDRELAAAGVPPERLADPRYVRASGFLEDAELFDAEHFGFGPREAEITDPQIRLFLECAWQALEDAGYAPGSDGPQAAVGVFAGAGSNAYRSRVRGGAGDGAEEIALALGNEPDFLATTVSYRLDLKGPSVAVQTACSTSLVAVHMACRSLLAGECDAAIAGGVSIRVPRRAGYLYEQGLIFSPDGHCRAFDARAGGTVAGDGVGAVVLKPLERALADGDAIRAVIRGTAINNDGAVKVGFTAPGVEGQAAVIAEALAEAGVGAGEIGYVEAHGTGTELGDPVEVAALTEAFRRTTGRRGYCALASVKSNVGHLNTAAGVAGLIKTVLALEHEALPPSLGFETPNPRIDFAAGPFFVNDRLRPWRRGEVPRRAGVSSFGIGGTNAHAVLEEAPPLGAPAPSRPAQLLVLSARSPEALEHAAERLAAHLENHPQAHLADAAYTLARGRRAFAHRRTVVSESPLDAARALREADSGHTGTAGDDAPPVVFLFPGQGAQHPEMARRLYRDEPAFRRTFDRCCERLEETAGLDLRGLLLEPSADAGDALRQTAVAQPALFAVEISLARMWTSWGVRPEAMIGHSLGELTAACVAGVMSLDGALELVAKRGRLVQSRPPGAMLAVRLPAAEVEPLLGAELALAAVNAPAACTVSGPAGAIEHLEGRLAARGAACRRLATSHAFHSAMVEPVLGEWLEALEAVELRPPRIPFVSNVTGTWTTAAEATDPRYWVRHLRETVRFGAGAKELLTDSRRVFLEVGPGRTLAAFVRQCARDRGLVATRAPAAGADPAACLAALGWLWSRGVEVDWAGFFAGERRRRVALPTTPFERRRYWIERDGPRTAEAPDETDRTAGFYVPSWKRAPRAARRPPAIGEAVVFSDPAGLGAELARAIADAGGRAVTVAPGVSFGRSPEGSITLDPGRGEHYDRLIATLDGEPTFFHLWGVTPSGDAGATLDLTFHSLVLLAQALGRRAGIGPARLLAVSNGMHDVTGDEALYPEKATVLGPVLVIPHEYPGVACVSADVTLPAAADARRRLAEQLLGECDAAFGEARVVAYRGPHRWVRGFEPVRLEAPAEAAPRLRRNGVYLITGGLGGIGQAIAEHLARSVGARLILTGRSPGADTPAATTQGNGGNGSGGRRSRTGFLEAPGAEIEVVRADAADRRQMAAAVARGVARFGRIDGVFHAAGVAGGGVIQRRTRRQAEAVMAPKVDGARVLGEVFADRPPDFMVLCSSLAGVAGGFGDVDYCAANAFLDAWAAARNGPDCFVTSIGWDTWRDVGMAFESAVPDAARRERLELGLSTAEGLEALRRVLDTDLPHVVVAKRHPETLTRGEPAWKDLPSQRRTAHPRPRLAGGYAAPGTDTEQGLVEIWQDLLGFDRVGIHDDFYQLGGDSLVATQVISRIHQRWQVALPVGGLLEEPTVASLAQRIETARLVARSATPLDEPLAEGEEQGEL